MVVGRDGRWTCARAQLGFLWEKTSTPKEGTRRSETLTLRAFGSGRRKQEIQVTTNVWISSSSQPAADTSKDMLGEVNARRVVARNGHMVFVNDRPFLPTLRETLRAMCDSLQIAHEPTVGKSFLHVIAGWFPTVSPRERTARTYQRLQTISSSIFSRPQAVREKIEETVGYRVRGTR